MEIVLTGMSGFVGQALLPRLLNKENNIRAAVRSLNKTLDGQISQFSIDNICKNQNWKNIVTGADIVIHCAARVHVMDDSASNPLDEFREVNTYGTLNLAQQAADAGVKRFIFISSIKVNGESTELGFPFKPDDNFIPIDPYGLSKHEAEIGLHKISEETGMEVVIIRPTLVYGPDVKANFASLLNLVSKGLPLPFGCITTNKRSLVSVTNLADLIMTCIEHPKAGNQVFLVSDDNDVSTASLVREMSKGLGKPSRMLPVPLWCYSVAGKLFNKQDVVSRLLGSLQVDISHTKETLGWAPPQTIEQGFKETADSFLKNREKTNDSIN
ncbi:UDP-glucose 4-epimerase family protein [Shewanella morhuae]|uniref:UDP-glucose 4-epimerase family protein n=1 Tax=Shewanella morhuae TaxID=365591 RepID=UPI001BC4A5A8|nr:SDR family oxidoreductase [Shewanella morhuae]GIU08562.1 UDP-glucose 4-epimerase [Shewanella morhuae]